MTSGRTVRTIVGWLGAAVTSGTLVQADPAAHAQVSPGRPSVSPREVLDRYCIRCHDDRLRTAGLSLAGLDPDRPGERAEIWEKVVRKLRAGAMPPPGNPRPEK